MCAITGVYSPDGNAAYIARRLLHEQQNRGQDTTGIATLDGRTRHLLKGQGKVNIVFSELQMPTGKIMGNSKTIKELTGNHAVGHNRYKTIGIGGAQNAQPFWTENERYVIIMSHNGHVNNYEQACKELNLEERMKKEYGYASDCDVVPIMYAFSDGMKEHELEKAVNFGALNVLHKIRGAYTVSAAVHDKKTGQTVQIAFKDPRGIRPGFFGKNGGAYAFASETFALERTGFRDIKPIRNGELVIIDPSLDGEPGVYRDTLGDLGYTPCQFEQGYFSRAASVIEGRSVNHGRFRLGQTLADKIKKERREWTHSADFVTFVPNTPLPIAKGVAKGLGMDFRDVMEKDTFDYEREFIKEEKLRHMDNKVFMHWDAVAGRNFILVDDSIVRGDTMKNNIGKLREAGAVNIYVASAYPRVIGTCDLGVDMKTTAELIAHGRADEEIRSYIGADGLIYLEQEEYANVWNTLDLDAGIRRKIELGIFSSEILAFMSNGNRCTACTTGKNPTHRGGKK